MKIEDQILKCCAFIGCKKVDGTFTPFGTVFFLGEESEDGKAKSIYAVTAKHVIDEIRNRGVDEVFIRANLKDGTLGWLQCGHTSWHYHPNEQNVDVAICPISIPEELDHLVYPTFLCATKNKLTENEVGLGDEVFITGLFRGHFGKRRNIPIVRVGNLSSLSDEKVSSRDFGEMDAHLIEARSIGGLSGSPVFLNLGNTRTLGGKLKFRRGGQDYLLFGLIHGHFDVNETEIDNLKNDDISSPERVNMGMAIVVPVEKILETISHYENTIK